jgi:hypothetical protein
MLIPNLKRLITPRNYLVFVKKLNKVVKYNIRARFLELPRVKIVNPSQNYISG